MERPERPPRDSEVFPDGQCRLVLIGRTGCGKSSTGNTIIGSEVFKAASGINSATKTARLESTIRDHLEIQVLDTPGLADTDGDDELLSKLILRSLCAMHPGPHAVLLVLRCDHRFTKEAYQVYLALKSIFGENLPKFMILIFVGFDNFQNDSKHFEEELLRSSESLQSLMKEANNRYLLFDNKCKEKRFEQVSRLLVQVKLLIRENNGRCFEHKLMPTIRNVLQRLVKEEESSMSAHDSNCPHLLNKLGQFNIHDQAPPIQTINMPTDMPTKLPCTSPEPTNVKRKPARPAPSPPRDKYFGEDRRAPSPPRDKYFGEDRRAARPPRDKYFGEDRRAARPPGDKCFGEERRAPSPPRDKCFGEDRRVPSPPRDKCFGEDRRAPSPPRDKCFGEERRAPSPHRDKCFDEDGTGMRFADKQAMVEDILKRRIINDKLTRDQDNTLHEASHGIYERIRKKMRKYSIKNIDACNLM